MILPASDPTFLEFECPQCAPSRLGVGFLLYNRRTGWYNCNSCGIEEKDPVKKNLKPLNGRSQSPNLDFQFFLFLKLCFLVFIFREIPADQKFRICTKRWKERKECIKINTRTSCRYPSSIVNAYIKRATNFQF